MKKAGYKTGIYASKYWYMTKIDISKLPADYCLWVASYGNNDGTIPDNVYNIKKSMTFGNIHQQVTYQELMEM